MAGCALSSLWRGSRRSANCLALQHFKANNERAAANKLSCDMSHDAGGVTSDWLRSSRKSSRKPSRASDSNKENRPMGDRPEQASGRSKREGKRSTDRPERQMLPSFGRHAPVAAARHLCLAGSHATTRVPARLHGRFSGWISPKPCLRMFRSRRLSGAQTLSCPC